MSNAPERGAAEVPAAWYPDPVDPGMLRWWDGTGWSPQVTVNPEPASPPAVSPDAAVTIEPFVVRPAPPHPGTSQATPSAVELRRRVRGAHATAAPPAAEASAREPAPRFRSRDQRSAGRAAYLRSL